MKHGESQFCDYQKFLISQTFSTILFWSNIEYTQHTIKHRVFNTMVYSLFNYSKF